MLKNFILAYTKNWLSLLAGPVATVLLVIISAFVPGWLRAVSLLLAGLCFLAASFGVWLDQEKRIAELTIRSYTEGHKQLARNILANLTHDEKDLLRYLLHFGERNERQIGAESGCDGRETREILMKAVRSGLVKREKRVTTGTGDEWFCSINPTFAEVLKDELAWRNEDPPSRLFLAVMPQ